MLQRLFSILGPFLILLLILDDKPSDVPVRGKHLRVDATDDPPARGEDFLLAGIVCDGILDSKAISEGGDYRIRADLGYCLGTALRA